MEVLVQWDLKEALFGCFSGKKCIYNQINNNQFGYSFAFGAPTVWNALPGEIRASPSLASFRKRLKTYLHT